MDGQIIFITVFLQISIAFIFEKVMLIVFVVASVLLITSVITFIERKSFLSKEYRGYPENSGAQTGQRQNGDRAGFSLRSFLISMVCALMLCAVIPWGGTIGLFGRSISLQVTDLNVGLLYVMAILSMGIYGVIAVSWGGSRKLPLPELMKIASRIIFFELILFMALAALVMVTNSFSLKDIVHFQKDGIWNIIYQPVGFLIFLVSSNFLINPFVWAITEDESHSGHEHYSANWRSGLLLDKSLQNLNVFSFSVIAATLFLGGYDVPFVNDNLSAGGIGSKMLIPVQSVVFFIKVFCLFILFRWLNSFMFRTKGRWMVEWGWRLLVTGALVNLILTGLIMLLK